MFPKDDPSFLFAVRHDQLPVLCHMITSSRMIHKSNPQRLDLLIEVKEGLNSRDLLDKLLWCPSVASRLTRPLHTKQAGMAKSFLVVQATQLSLRQQLHPEYTTVCMLTTGSHLDQRQCNLPTAPPDTFCVHMDEKVMPSSMFASMSFEERRGQLLGNCAVVMQLFFKKSVHDTHRKKSGLLY